MHQCPQRCYSSDKFHDPEQPEQSDHRRSLQVEETSNHDEKVEDVPPVNMDDRIYGGEQEHVRLGAFGERLEYDLNGEQPGHGIFHNVQRRLFAYLLIRLQADEQSRHNHNEEVERLKNRGGCDCKHEHCKPVVSSTPHASLRRYCPIGVANVAVASVTVPNSRSVLPRLIQIHSVQAASPHHPDCQGAAVVILVNDSVALCGANVPMLQQLHSLIVHVLQHSPHVNSNLQQVVEAVHKLVVVSSDFLFEL
mmetsp:Transcript_34498/g.78685  ORF Transcript_34498/g.78685 Transcript_34498/m.78685 type:complete len:251 (-) Transcript_34498:1108-1860(-)